MSVRATMITVCRFTTFIPQPPLELFLGFALHTSLQDTSDTLPENGKKALFRQHSFELLHFITKRLEPNDTGCLYAITPLQPRSQHHSMDCQLSFLKTNHQNTRIQIFLNLFFNSTQHRCSPSETPASVKERR